MPAPSPPICTSLSKRCPRRTGHWRESWATRGRIEMSADTTGGATEFAHMLLKVSDIEKSQRFYVDLLGFTVRPAKPLADGRPFVPFRQGLALTSGRPVGSPQIDHIAFK